MWATTSAQELADAAALPPRSILGGLAFLRLGGLAGPSIPPPERASTGATIRSDRPLRHYADGQAETHAGDAAIEIVADFPAIPDWVEPGWVSAGWVDRGQAGYQVMLRELDQMNRASH
jgi:hypothetical protein